MDISIVTKYMMMMVIEGQLFVFLFGKACGLVEKCRRGRLEEQVSCSAWFDEWLAESHKQPIVTRPAGLHNTRTHGCVLFRVKDSERNERRFKSSC